MAKPTSAAEFIRLAKAQPVFVEGPLRARGAVHCLTANVPRVGRRQSSAKALALLGLVTGVGGLAVAFALRRRLSRAVRHHGNTDWT